MKFIIDTKTLDGFVQFVTLPEREDLGAIAHAQQFRMSPSNLGRLHRLVQLSIAKIVQLDETFHDVAQARFEFENGTVMTEPGSPLFTAIILQRRVTLLANGVTLFSSIGDLENLRKSIAKALKTVD